jgi:hypothetical protein
VSEKVEKLLRGIAAAEKFSTEEIEAYFNRIHREAEHTINLFSRNLTLMQAASAEIFQKNILFIDCRCGAEKFKSRRLGR